MKKLLSVSIILLSITLLGSCNKISPNDNSWFIIKEFDVDIDICSSLNEYNWVLSEMKNDNCEENFIVQNGGNGIAKGTATVYKYEDSSLAHSAFRNALFYNEDVKETYIPEVSFFDGSMVRIGNQLVVGMNESVCDMLKELKLIGSTNTAKHHGEGNIYPLVESADSDVDEKQQLDAFLNEGYQINEIPPDVSFLPYASRRYLIFNNDMSIMRLMYSCESESEANDCMNHYVGACMGTADFSGVSLLKKGNLVIVYYTSDIVE